MTPPVASSHSLTLPSKEDVVMDHVDSNLIPRQPSIFTRSASSNACASSRASPEDSRSTRSRVGSGGATGCGLSADIRIRICLQSGYGYHFFTSVNIRICILRCGCGYGKSNILFVSNLISKCWVLDNNIRMKKLFFNGIRH